jgi:MSHA pilin protein MshD
MSIPKAKIVISHQRGLSLIELIVFIVIISVGLAGILLVMDQTTRSSADPFIRKQSLAIAESLLEEIVLMPFTYCDPNDALAAVATSPAGCDATAEGLGPETGETRYSATTPFDNVSDYHNFLMNAGNGGIRDIIGNVIGALDSYTASVTLAESVLGGIAAIDSLLITVTVTGPNSEPVVLQGYRTRFSPRTVP